MGLIGAPTQAWGYVVKVQLALWVDNETFNVVGVAGSSTNFFSSDRLTCPLTISTLKWLHASPIL